MSNSLRVLTEPTIEPVTLAEAKLHARIDTSADDVEIAVMITAARVLIERHTRRSLINQTFRYQLDEFPHDNIRLPRSPLVEISVGGSYAYAMPRIRYYDNNATQQTLTYSTGFELDLYDNPPRLNLLPNVIWPVSQVSKQKAVEVDFVAGYGTTAASVPALLRMAIMMLVSHWYEHRTAVDVGAGTELPLAVDTILKLYDSGDYQ